MNKGKAKFGLAREQILCGMPQWWEGGTAYIAGISRGDNPYRPIGEGSDKYFSWDLGWHHAREQARES
jgi:hypothetical protein